MRKSSMVNRQWSVNHMQRRVNPPYGAFLRKALLFHFSFFIFHFSFAQKISASLDREKIVLGEQVTLQLKAEDINAKSFFIASWFNIPDTAGHLQVVKREPVDTVDVNGLSTYLQTITLTSFDSGKWQLPPLKITIQEIASGKQTQLKAGNLSLYVLPVDVSGLKNYHEIKDIIEVNAGDNDYSWIIAVSVSALVLAVLIFLLLRRRKKIPGRVAKPVLKGTAYERAQEKINALQKENLPAKGYVKIFYQKLDEICRNYFDEQLQMGSSKSTGDEIMLCLKIYLDEEQLRTQFYQLIRLTNAVKFAKYIPRDEENKQAVETAERVIQYIAKLYQHLKKNYA